MDTTTEMYNDSTTANATDPTNLDDPLAVALNALIAILLAVIMVGMGCSVELPKMWFHLKRPTGIITGFVCQFGIMPLTAFILTLIFSLSDYQALALLIQASCPGGSSSNLATYWMDGDMDLSITMTSFSTLLALGMMPLLLFLYGLTFDQSLVVPYDSIAIILATLVVPIAIGVFLRHKFPSKALIVLRVCSIGGIIIIIGVAIISIATYSGVWLITAFQIITAIILPLVGMLCGYGLSSLVSLHPRLYLKHHQRRTVSAETGIQNTQLCGSIILLSGFTFQQIGEMVLVPLLYAMAQVFWCVVMVIGYRLYRRKYPRQPLEEDLEESKKGEDTDLEKSKGEEMEDASGEKNNDSDTAFPPAYSSYKNESYLQEEKF